MKAIVVFTAYFTHKARTCIYISSWTGRHRQLSDIELHTTYIYIYIEQTFSYEAKNSKNATHAANAAFIHAHARTISVKSLVIVLDGISFVDVFFVEATFPPLFARFVSTSGLEGDAGGARCAPSLCIAYNAHAKTKGVTASPLRREEYAPIAVAANAVPIAANICTLADPTFATTVLRLIPQAHTIHAKCVLNGTETKLLSFEKLPFTSNTLSFAIHSANASAPKTNALIQCLFGSSVQSLKVKHHADCKTFASAKNPVAFAANVSSLVLKNDDRVTHEFAGK